ncbi:hypothetical protein C8R44DRAFT_819487 [Mycena epipterygia]|nr:hypothetical protein C8R44DRAFT_819487 [Mycena epipterygia]
MLPDITTDLLSSAMESRPTFFHHTIRHLMMAGVDTPTLKYILSICSGVHNLWVANDLTQMISVMEPLRLKHFYAKILPFLHTLTPFHPFFSQITHLDLMDALDARDLETWSELYLIPQLTHLSFNDDAFLPLCGELLETCKSLTVLVFLESIPDPSSVTELSRDFRFVGMCCEYYHLDWQMGAYAGFIAKRRFGEIDALQYEILVDESENLY